MFQNGEDVTLLDLDITSVGTTVVSLVKQTGSTTEGYVIPYLKKPSGPVDVILITASETLLDAARNKTDALSSGSKRCCGVYRNNFGVCFANNLLV